MGDTFGTKTLINVVKSREEAESGIDGDDNEQKRLLHEPPSHSIQHSEIRRHGARRGVSDMGIAATGTDCLDCRNDLGLREYWLSITWVVVAFTSACCYGFGIAGRNHRKDILAISGLLLLSISVIMITYHSNRIKPARILQKGRDVTVQQIKIYLRQQKGVRFR